MKNKENNKKSQMEIMGMMMVVILIVIGIVIFLVLSLNSNSGQDTRQVYLQKEISSNTLTAIARTNVPACGNGVDIGDLVKECYKYNCEGENGCLYLNITLEYMLNKTIKENSNYNYEFFVYDSQVDDYRSDKNIYINQSTCINADNKEVATVQIPYNYGKIKIMRLEVC